jgi:cysteine synthase A
MKVYNSILELTGNTPLVRLNKIEEKYNLNVKLLAKLEMFNPSGSVKVRPAKNMLLKALHENLITKDTTIIEPTSGNMGIALAFVCATLGMKFIAVMPENMSIERLKIIQAYGAEIVLTKQELGMIGALNKANILRESLNGFIPSQFDNINNPNSHYDTTAKEIIEDTFGEVDIVVAGVGTGGTISGIGRNLKEIKNVLMVAVEPEASPVLRTNVAGKHKIQGIGANFIPDNFDFNVVDDIVGVSDNEAINTARELARLEGIFVGISSGAALFGAIKFIEENQIKDKTIVVILPDTGERYLSTVLLDD